MRIIVLRCGDQPLSDSAQQALAHAGHIDLHKVSAIPTRAELNCIDSAAAEILPTDPTPSLEEISARPDIAHLGAPAPAPQPVPIALRVVVYGTDASLSAVLTRLMRADTLWVEIAYVPVNPAESTAAHNWGLPQHAPEAWEMALTAPVRPAPLIRNDSGQAVAGSASISDWEGQGFNGEIVVDDHLLVSPNTKRKVRSFGARLVPMTDAPGLAAATAMSRPVDSTMPAVKDGLGERLRRLIGHPTPAAGTVDPGTLCTGRAVQAGGPQVRVIVDGIPARRPQTRVTFYRHLRDLQVVRSA